MEIPEISVIVPAYNIEQYLRKCLDSILEQTFTRLEIIIVNDASTDMTPSIITEYAKRDGRIIPVDNGTNLGLFLTRLEGVKRAKGNYVTFVDGDDYLENSAYEIMHRKAKEGPFDIVACKVNRVVGGKIKQDFLAGATHNEIINGLDIFKNLLLEKISNSVWNKVYSREVINNILRDPLFKQVTEYQRSNHLRLVIEDQLFNFFAAIHASNYISVETPLYYYIQRKDSLTTSKRKEIRDIWPKSAMYNFSVLEKIIERSEVYRDLMPAVEKMKHRLIVRRKRKVLSFFTDEVKAHNGRFNRMVDDLEQLVGSEYLLKHIINEAQLEIAELHSEKEELENKVVRLHARRNRSFIERLVKNLRDPVKLLSKIATKVKG